MTPLRYFLLLLISLIAIGCDDGIYRERSIYPYYLEYFEEANLFTLEKKGNEVQGGVFEGIVHEIGWTDKFILAKIEKHYRDGSDGLYSVDVTSGEVKGPLTEADVAKNGNLSEIELKDVSTVWRELLRLW